jgi:hypothetical protein
MDPNTRRAPRHPAAGARIDGGVVVIGESVRVRPYELAGATARAADDPAAVRAAWLALPDDTVLVVLTPHAARSLGSAPAARGDLLVVEMPA